ncbi:hypothetical protein A2U01_0108636, partial [Trifolium medium]|nr:hypothetical protein [Trifolium medium]
HVDNLIKSMTKEQDEEGYKAEEGEGEKEEDTGNDETNPEE